MGNNQFQKLREIQSKYIPYCMMSKQLPSETNGQMQPPVYCSAHIRKLDHKSGTYTVMYDGYYNSSIRERNKDVGTNKQDGTALSLYRSA